MDKWLKIRPLWLSAGTLLILLFAYGANSPAASGLSPESAVPVEVEQTAPLPIESPEPPGTIPPGPPFSADCNEMTATGQSRENVLPDVVIVWDSSFHCIEAEEEGTYGFTTTVSLEGPADTSILLNALGLTHTTPRPQGEPPTATVDLPVLPLLITAEGAEVTVSGEYKLATPGATALANLHFCAEGQVQESGTPFSLGINAHLRGAKGGPPGGSSGAAPPVLSDIQVTPGANSMVVTWRTDQPASGQVHVKGGPSDAEQTVSGGCDITEEHEVEVAGLVAGSTYTVEVSAQSTDGVVAASEELQVTTRAFDGVNVFLPVVAQ